jgi:hypothetical protein
VTKGEAQQLAEVAHALGSAAAADAIYDAWQRGRSAGLTEAAQMCAEQARALRLSAMPEHEPDEARRNGMARKAFAVEQAVRQIEARRVPVHFAYRGQDPTRDYLACDAEITGTASVGDWDRVTCPDCLAFRARCPR